MTKSAAITLLLVSTFALSANAHADDRPTSGEMSLSSGRTLGIGRSMLGAGIGWPGLFAEFDTGITSRFTLGVRGTALYGSPVMGFAMGMGAELAAPMRFHLWGHDRLDLALTLKPAFVAGQGALAGEGGTFDNDASYSGRLEVGSVIGAALTSSTTFILGVSGSGGYATTPDANQSYMTGSIHANVGIEGLMSRDTMLFVLFDGGYGFAPANKFDKHVIVSLYLGLGYEL